MRVLIVDDQALVRVGLIQLVRMFADVDIVDEASTAEQALNLVTLHQPDVVLLDLSPMGRLGLSTLTRMLSLNPSTRVIMLSTMMDIDYIRHALDCGASGFLLKNSDILELEVAIRTASTRQVFLTPQITSLLMAPLMARQKRGGVNALPPRQRQILRLLGRGLSNKEIAAQLKISVKTVETHRARMMETLDCRRANDLLLMAIKLRHELG